VDEQLRMALARFLESTADALEAGGGYILSEAPEVITQLLLWSGVLYFLKFLAGLGVVAAILYVNKKQIDWIKAQGIQDLREDLGFVAEIGVLNLFQAFWMLPLFLLVNFEWLKIWIAPKLWIMEYIQNALK
jgi:hypothetical protein